MTDTIEAGATTARLNAAIESTMPHLRPVLVAVRDWRVGLLFASQGRQAFTIPPKPKRAAVVIIGDDMHQSVGPDGFHLPSVRRGIRACRAFAVVAGAPDPDVYTAVTAGAVGGLNVMIVETRPEHEIQWVSLIQKLAPGRALILTTVKGGTA